MGMPPTTPLSIADDDICSDCEHLDYRPGELSPCSMAEFGCPIPGVHDGQKDLIVSCEKFKQRTKIYAWENVGSTEINGLVRAARDVVNNWEKGDLADAVRDLDIELRDNANITLVTTAPELLKACRHAAQSEHHPACKCKGDYLVMPETYCACHVQKARAAIAKIEGGLPCQPPTSP